ncbi:MAG: transcriptional initiation protein Tat [Gammaproteobacteria bacterium]|jgi:nitrous oxide reductase|nr:transcriptional initiation protein Tat [Gammaproteobacteria bacterium]
MSKQDVRPGRRSFLRKTALFGGAAAAVSSVAAVAMSDQGAHAPQAAPEVDAQPRGYEATPHVLKYYDKARF